MVIFRPYFLPAPRFTEYLIIMRFVVKYFSEIIVKSRPVRSQFSKRLADNLRQRLKEIDRGVIVEKGWDKIVIDSKLPLEQKDAVIEVLNTTPGVGQFLFVQSFPLDGFESIGPAVLELFKPLIDGKTFVVRAKRSGNHDFNSHEVEMKVGGYLLHNTDALGVKLKGADYTVKIEIRNDVIFAVKEQHQGPGGFPLGTMAPVLSLLSGGFDSTVASYETMRRGMSTHFLFFNLGGHAHEVGVKEVAYYLWQKYGSNIPVKFVSVPFMDVVAEMLRSVPSAYRGVVLKRMMMRAASKIADKLNIDAIVTGEAIGQVASQTLPNLSLIDSASDVLVLRPLITADKGDIVATSHRIGAFEFAESMPEYCGIISTKPVTRGTKQKAEESELEFDFAVLDQAVADTQITKIHDLAEADTKAPEVEVLSAPLYQSTIVDIRHPDEIDQRPLDVDTNNVVEIPFFKLYKQAESLDKKQHYMLYCARGVMSKLHAGHLKAEGFDNVSVYRP